jgi:hypothetical protein
MCLESYRFDGDWSLVVYQVNFDPAGCRYQPISVDGVIFMR